MIVKSAEELRDVAHRALRAAGADEESAAAVADHLVLADLSGVGSHGVRHLPRYLADIAAGRLDPAAKPQVLDEGPTYALVSGNWTFGQVAAQFAIETAVRKALRTGVAAVGLVQSHHIGRLGHYAEHAAEHGAVALIWAGGYSEHEPRAAPYGGRRRLLSTNPIAVGFPGGAEGALVADFATTGVATSRIVQARERGEQLPPESLVDRDGEPTTDPAAFFDGGAHLPFGGHKGYAIMLAAEWLGRIFTGSDDFADAARAGPIYGHQGVAIVAARADLFTPLETFRRRSDEMIRRAHEVPPAAGFDRVLVPGEPERASRERGAAEGIALTAEVWASLEGLLATAGRRTAGPVDG